MFQGSELQDSADVGNDKKKKPTRNAAQQGSESQSFAHYLIQGSVSVGTSGVAPVSVGKRFMPHAEDLVSGREEKGTA